MDETVNVQTAPAAEHDDLEDRFLLFRISDALYGLSLSVVLEIINLQNVTYLPCVAPYVKGIINLRGKVVPVVDLRLKLGLPEREHDDMTCIIILSLHDMHIGLIVDSVSEVLTLSQEQLCSPPSLGCAENRYLSSVAQFGEEVMLNLSAERLFEDDLDLNL